MPVVEAFKKAVSLIEELRLKGTIDDYALIGGLALSAWTKPRTTRDVDMIVSVSEGISWKNLADDLEKLFHRKVYSQIGTRRTNIREKLSFVFGQIAVDLIGTKEFELAAEAVRHALPINIFGTAVKVATPEYLVLLKLLPLSEQDALDIKRLIGKTDRKKLAALAERHKLLVRLKPFLGFYAAVAANSPHRK